MTRLFDPNNDTDRPCVGSPTVNVPPVAVPTAFDTVTGRWSGPTGTAVVICVAEFTVNVAVVPLNFTEVAPTRFDPAMTTAVPANPIVGVNEEITGGPRVKSVVLTVLTGVVTEILPVVAPSERSP